ncbi:MAG: hypothetical protein AB9844_00225 [Clostridiaceae bacterium]
MKVWSLIVPSQVMKFSDYMLEAISYGCINFAALFWLINITNKFEFKTKYVAVSSQVKPATFRHKPYNIFV